MTIKTTLLFLLIGFSSWSQTVKIDTFVLPMSERFKDIIPSDEMFYPIVRTGNDQIDSMINFDLKNRYTQNEFPDESLDSTLIKWASDGIVYMDFEVTYNKNSILSLQIQAEGCGAYCTNWTSYFNYSTKNGLWLSISDIIDTTQGFYERVSTDARRQYNDQRDEIFEWANNPDDSGMTMDDYELANSYYLECEKNFNLNTYSLHSEFIEIIEDCWMPHIMRNLTPVIELKYHYLELEQDLKIKL